MTVQKSNIRVCLFIAMLFLMGAVSDAPGRCAGSRDTIAFGSESRLTGCSTRQCGEGAGLTRTLSCCRNGGGMDCTDQFCRSTGVVMFRWQAPDLKVTDLYSGMVAVTAVPDVSSCFHPIPLQTVPTKTPPLYQLFAVYRC